MMNQPLPVRASTTRANGVTKMPTQSQHVKRQGIAVRTCPPAAATTSTVVPPNTARVVVSSEKIGEFHLYPAHTSGLCASQVLVPDVVARKGRRGPCVAAIESPPVENTPRGGRRVHTIVPSQAAGYAGIDTPRTREQSGRRIPHGLASRMGHSLMQSDVITHSTQTTPRMASGTPDGRRRASSPGGLSAPWGDNHTPNVPPAHSFGRRPNSVIASMPFIPGTKVFTNQQLPPTLDRQVGYRHRQGSLGGIL